MLVGTLKQLCQPLRQYCVIGACVEYTAYNIMLITAPPTLSTQMYINGIGRALASGTGVTWSDSEQPPSAITVLVTGHNPIGTLEV